MRRQRIVESTRRTALMALVGVTRALSRADMNVPTKWNSFIDSFRISASMLNGKLMEIDDEVSEEVIEKEEMLEMRLGREKFYSESELRKLSERRDEIDI